MFVGVSRHYGVLQKHAAGKRLKINVIIAFINNLKINLSSFDKNITVRPKTEFCNFFHNDGQTNFFGFIKYNY